MTSLPSGATTQARFPSQPESVALARRLVTRALAGADRPDLVHTVALLTSETVTNAVLHAGTEIVVTCRVAPDRVRVAVADQSPVVPGILRYGLEATTGRGLTMVDLIASAWGVESHPEGKSVWFEVTTAGSAPTTDRSSAPVRRTPTAAGHEVGGDQPDRLHEGVGGGGGDEAEPAGPEALGQRRRSRRPGRQRTPSRASRALLASAPPRY